MAKVCIRCGQDCSTRPRVKDAQGRYACRACVKPATPTETDIIPLEDDPAGIASAASEQPRVCGNCGLILGRDTVICTRCGFNTITGAVMATDQRPDAGPRCLKCGYSLAGLKVPRCPECGTINTRSERRRAAEAREARATVRSSYTKPLIMFVVGLILAVLLAAASEDASAEEAIKWYLIKYALYVPSGLIVFLACCALWIGFDAPIHLTALRLAGVYAVTDAVAAVMSWVPIPVVPWLVVLLTYVGLLQDMLDLELHDAIILALVTFLVRFVVAMGVAAYFM